MKHKDCRNCKRSVRWDDKYIICTSLGFPIRAVTDEDLKILIDSKVISIKGNINGFPRKFSPENIINCSMYEDKYVDLGIHRGRLAPRIIRK